jgi:hypothetical protein
VFQTIVRRLILLFAALLTSAALVAIAAAGAAGASSFTTKGAWSFFSAPTLHPPKIRVDRTGKGKLAGGDFMLANTKNVAFTQTMVGQGGPLILDRHLQPVWFMPVVETVSKQGSSEVGSNATFNLSAQTYQGHRVLTWWRGTVTGTGVPSSGEDFVYNQHYQQVATLVAQGPTGCTPGTDCWVLSGHEFVIRGHSAWVTAYRSVPMNLTPYGGPANGTLVDTAVQRYDLTTGQLVFSWDAMQHIPLSDSHIKPLSDGTWDAYHENSVSVGNGTFLVSMRNTWSAYDVSESTNKTLWTLSGDPKLSSFKVPASASFQWQHDVELHPGGLVSVFDDHCCGETPAGKIVAPPASSPSSRGLVLKLDFTHHTASPVGRYSRSSSLDAIVLGNTQLLSGGNVVVGWGGEPNFSEFTKSGALLFDAAIPKPDESYRTYLQNWVGFGIGTPSGAVRKSGGKTLVYASWNGATQIAAWRVLAGATATHLTKAVSRAPKTGFETSITVPGNHKFFELQALDSHGHVLGTSKAFSLSQPTLVGGY